VQTQVTCDAEGNVSGGIMPIQVCFILVSTLCLLLQRFPTPFPERAEQEKGKTQRLATAQIAHCSRSAQFASLVLQRLLCPTRASSGA
jgi:hypothetical protein